MTTAADWHRLDAALDAWQRVGRTVSLWWRDDDAAEATPALTRLLDLQQSTGIPLTLAVIPGQATPALAAALAGRVGICAAQHGFLHRNHAAADAKKSEFPPGRPAPEALADLAAGRRRLAALLGDSDVLPLLVPPWNRFDEGLLPALPELGFTAISTFKAAPAYWAAPGLARLNAHLDPVDWRGRGTGGPAACLETAVDLLAGLREGNLAPQPLGLLSHHLRHDGAGWDFLGRFLAVTAAHPAVRWLDARTAMETGKPSAGVMSRS
jgi:hypothetical protein